VISSRNIYPPIYTPDYCNLTSRHTSFIHSATGCNFEFFIFYFPASRPWTSTSALRRSRTLPPSLVPKRRQQVPQRVMKRRVEKKSENKFAGCRGSQEGRYSGYEQTFYFLQEEGRRQGVVVNICPVCRTMKWWLRSGARICILVRPRYFLLALDPGITLASFG